MFLSKAQPHKIKPLAYTGSPTGGEFSQRPASCRQTFPPPPSCKGKKVEGNMGGMPQIPEGCSLGDWSCRDPLGARPKPVWDFGRCNPPSQCIPQCLVGMQHLQTPLHALYLRHPCTGGCPGRSGERSSTRGAPILHRVLREPGRGVPLPLRAFLLAHLMGAVAKAKGR